ncbi:Egg cell-secreted protein 1.1 [Melia azedarach]|uniref:Egg cell-secreted protein 1.1 n=1 Tax=Melia azedarach TaxID=155640 RepID=A0ACC1XVC5_MELAZ|nr:Egg cell-secreted protein 1.1 [Melia azedarach]
MALKNALLILVLTCFTAYASATRSNDLKFFYKPPAFSPADSPQPTGTEFFDCWKALLSKFNSCSKVTIKFFLTGKAEVSSECCSAIETSKSKCSPPGSSKLGFTSQGDILSAYCAALSPAPSPA